MVGKSYINVSWVYILLYTFKENIKLVTSRNYCISCTNKNFYVWNQYFPIFYLFFFFSLPSKSNFELIHFEILSKNFDSNRITATPLIIVIQKGHESGVRVNAPLAKKVQKVGNDQHVKQFRRVRVFDDVTNAIPPPPSSS